MIIEDDGSRCGEVLGSAMMLGNKCRGSGTSTRQIDTGTPKQKFNSSQVVLVPLSPVPVPPSKSHQKQSGTDTTLTGTDTNM